ncbi:MAG: class II aldolase/adducin family protein [Proteobacteria bacterium]|nr:class II aldolase/adducin family protein [Pseudomonadota bacterium]
MSVTTLRRAATRSLRDQVSEAEWQARVELAACYRLMAAAGVFDLTYNHLSARLPDHPEHYLIKGERQLFQQVTASSLVKYDFEGNKLIENPYSVSRGGLVIHGGVLEARADLAAVFHTHTAANIAVSCHKVGLLPISQHALHFYGTIGYHEFAGFEFDLEGRKRLNRDLEGRRVMLMRNHGALVCGRSIPEAYVQHHNLEMACQAQIGALAAGGVDQIVIPSDAVATHAAQQAQAMGPITRDSRDWAALLELADKLDPSYRD